MTWLDKIHVGDCRALMRQMIDAGVSRNTGGWWITATNTRAVADVHADAGSADQGEAAHEARLAA